MDLVKVKLRIVTATSILSLIRHISRSNRDEQRFFMIRFHEESVIKIG